MLLINLEQFITKYNTQIILILKPLVNQNTTYKILISLNLGLIVENNFNLHESNKLSNKHKHKTTIIIQHKLLCALTHIPSLKFTLKLPTLCTK